jgi:hypothetical protein
MEASLPGRGLTQTCRQDTSHHNRINASYRSRRNRGRERCATKFGCGNICEVSPESAHWRAGSTGYDNLVHHTFPLQSP